VFHINAVWLSQESARDRLLLLRKADNQRATFCLGMTEKHHSITSDCETRVRHVLVTSLALEITDPIQARRFRYAQYRGEKAPFKLNGLSVTGTVRSVLEDKSATPTRWIVSIHCGLIGQPSNLTIRQG
jgi:hypothetical protein